MARYIKVAAAQMGPNNEGTSREEIVDRMLGLLEQAVAEGVEILAYPEMALTTYFPKRVRDDFDQFFETEMPPKALAPLLQRARDEAHRVALRYHRRRRGAKAMETIFETLDGVGPVRRRAILRHFGSVERFLDASQEELEGVPGLPQKTARALYGQLHKAGPS